VCSDAGCKKIKMTLDPRQPISVGEYATQQFYQEFKEAQHIAMLNARQVIKDVNNEFAKKYKRKYGDGLIETYNMDRAKHAIITMGTVSGTMKHFIATNKIKDIGLVRIKSFRPFPGEELRKLLASMNSVGVFEKVISPGLGGPLYHEIKPFVSKPAASFVGGLGGRDVTLNNIKNMFELIRKKDQNMRFI
jgi:pyruvate ferredoxin oxidoreductase alpha subunit